MNQLGFFVIITLRVFSAMSILISPFWGMLFALMMDNIDVVLIKLFNIQLSIYEYEVFDKSFDTLLILFAFFYAIDSNFIPEPLNIVAVVLFFTRILGTIFYFITRNRTIFILTPNFYTYLFLAIAYVSAYRPHAPDSTVLSIILLLFAFNLIQELVLHGNASPTWSKFMRKLDLSYEKKT